VYRSVQLRLRPYKKWANKYFCCCLPMQDFTDPKLLLPTPLFHIRGELLMKGVGEVHIQHYYMAFLPEPESGVQRHI
jgi:hypothetical protein